jgi:hypothetical protein
MIVLVSILLYPHSYFYFFSICAAPTICSKLHSKLHALSLFSPEPPTTLAPFRLLPGPSPSTSLPAVRGVGAPPQLVDLVLLHLLVVFSFLVTSMVLSPSGEIYRCCAAVAVLHGLLVFVATKVSTTSINSPPLAAPLPPSSFLC